MAKNYYKLTYFHKLPKYIKQKSERKKRNKQEYFLNKKLPLNLLGYKSQNMFKKLPYKKLLRIPTNFSNSL